jgi:DNA-binding NtrC family response regulator
MRSLGLVLIVDDNAPLRRALGRMLQCKGHTVSLAASGSEALVALSATEFDIVISDVRMPDMTGVELLEKVREHDRDLPVLLMSGNPDLNTASRAADLGALEYLAKPVTLDMLDRCVTRALELRQRQQETSATENDARPLRVPVGSMSTSSL